MNKNISSVDAYIDRHANWAEQLNTLRQILLSTELAETIKWGAPTYTIDSKNVVAIGAFKSYVGLWFFNGALLKDADNCLVNAQDGKTKALRQWRFNSDTPIDKALVLTYVQEAIENQKQGRSIKPAKPSKKFTIPDELQNALENDATLAKKFSALAPYKQKEYATHIGSAKREATRLSRLEKALPLIEQGQGLNDKYRNC